MKVFVVTMLSGGRLQRSRVDEGMGPVAVVGGSEGLLYPRAHRGALPQRVPAWLCVVEGVLYARSGYAVEPSSAFEELRPSSSAARTPEGTAPSVGGAVMTTSWSKLPPICDLVVRGAIFRIAPEDDDDEASVDTQRSGRIDERSQTIGTARDHRAGRPLEPPPSGSTRVHPLEPPPSGSTRVHPLEPPPSGSTRVHPLEPPPSGSTRVHPLSAQLSALPAADVPAFARSAPSLSPATYARPLVGGPPPPPQATATEPKVSPPFPAQPPPAMNAPLVPVPSLHALPVTSRAGGLLTMSPLVAMPKRPSVARWVQVIGIVVPILSIGVIVAQLKGRPRVASEEPVRAPIAVATGSWAPPRAPVRAPIGAASVSPTASSAIVSPAASSPITAPNSSNDASAEPPEPARDVAGERRVAQAIFAGDHARAAEECETLVAAHPDTADYPIMLRVLRAKARRARR